MLTEKQCPFTGPYFGPSDRRGPNKGPTAEALKRALRRLKYLAGDMADYDEHYNRDLETAMKRWQRSLPDVQPTGQYGKGTWEAMRGAKVLDGPHKGEYALDHVSLQLITGEWLADQLPDVDDVRTAIADFCIRAENHEGLWHYTQRRPFSGMGDPPDVTHNNDCSGYVVLAYRHTRETTNVAVPDPSQHNYAGYGNTWDNLDGHPRVTPPYQVGDLAHFDGHVMICRHSGNSSTAIWSSMGSEGGPNARQLYYRDDFLFVVRPPLGV